jgi:hypothetical protein
VQLTERDNYIYHEMIAHVPLMAHGAAKRVLIIGGGDGGTLKEVLKHPVEHVVLIEIDDDVIELSKRFFPQVSDGAFEDRRVNLVIGDGVEYVTQTEAKFDAVIVDSTDPIGPGELFTKALRTLPGCSDRVKSPSKRGTLPIQSSWRASAAGLPVRRRCPARCACSHLRGPAGPGCRRRGHSTAAIHQNAAGAI